jgi:hypothetical protein
MGNDLRAPEQHRFSLDTVDCMIHERGMLISSASGSASHPQNCPERFGIQGVLQSRLEGECSCSKLTRVRPALLSRPLEHPYLRLDIAGTSLPEWRNNPRGHPLGEVDTSLANEILRVKSHQLVGEVLYTGRDEGSY